MANPQEYTYTAAGARTVQAKLDIADAIIRVSVEDLKMLNRLPRRTVNDSEPKKLEDDLQAIDTTNYYAEDSVAPAAASTARTINTAYVQLLKKTALVTNTGNAISQYGLAKEYDYQKFLRMREIARDVETFIISAQAGQAATPANARTAKMAGLGAIITTNTNTVANFSQANFETLVRAAVSTYGGNPTWVCLDATRKNAVATWTAQVTRYTNEPAKLYNETQVFVSTIGQTLTFELHKHMPKLTATGPVCIGLDLQQSGWEIVQLLPLQAEDLAYTGVGPSCQIQWSLAVLWGAQKANLVFVG